MERRPPSRVYIVSNRSFGARGRGRFTGANMNAIFDALTSSNASANIQFFVLFALGVGVGWLMARPCGWSCWFSTLAVVGVSGAWLGAEAAYRIGQAPRGGGEQLLAAMAGAALMVHLWRRLHPRPHDDHHIAIHR